MTGLLIRAAVPGDMTALRDVYRDPARDALGMAGAGFVVTYPGGAALIDTGAGLTSPPGQAAGPDGR